VFDHADAGPAFRPGFQALFLMALLGELIFGRPSPVVAQETVEVRAVAILASKEHDRTDPRLKELADLIRKKHPEWRGFEVSHQSKAKLKRDKTEVLKLGADLVARVTWGGFDPDGRTMLTVKLPTLEEFTYSCCCTKFLPVVTRYQTADGKVLIVALNVQPCEKVP
jgi:hypothetical protein